ncbi:acyltransferase family protein [Aneurinibacillus uraniidurans]|uniref:acyltransferase family protein n=1 Tax=Aneurinibacillus uraniidurans TaxID=2966586 RepID=UPI0023498468|nr:acyltransferase [Aneurinibacillus sp. B1]WCN39261.1 acyltransferase [Aneurinibacillus sp. B1]
MQEDRQPLAALYLIQLISAFLVLAGHYTADVDDFIIWTTWEEKLNQFSRYGTVILAILTGYFTAYSLERKQVTMHTFFRGKLVHIFLPFIVSGIVYTLVLKRTIPYTAQYWTRILSGDAAGHLYFVFMLAQYYVFAYVFQRWIKRSNILVVCAVFAAFQYGFINNTPAGWLALGVRHFLPAWIFTFYTGDILYRYRSMIFTFFRKHSFVWFGLAVAATSSTIYVLMSPKLYTANHLSFVLGTWVWLVVVLYVLARCEEWLRIIPFRKGLTFQIYLWHPLFIIVGNKLFQRVGRLEWVLAHKWASAIYLGSLFIATYSMSALYIEGLKWIHRRTAEKKEEKEQTVAWGS